MKRIHRNVRVFKVLHTGSLRPCVAGAVVMMAVLACSCSSRSQSNPMVTTHQVTNCVTTVTTWAGKLLAAGNDLAAKNAVIESELTLFGNVSPVPDETVFLENDVMAARYNGLTPIQVAKQVTRDASSWCRQHARSVIPASTSTTSITSPGVAVIAASPLGVLYEWTSSSRVPHSSGRVPVNDFNPAPWPRAQSSGSLPA